MANFRPKPWTNPFAKMSIFRLFQLLVVNVEMGFFVLEYHKRHFPGQYCLKTKGGKVANFRPKPCTNPFEKMSIFRGFQLLVFIGYKCVFSF